MTLMMMWCTEKVKDENEKLTKQLEETNRKLFLTKNFTESFCSVTSFRSGKIPTLSTKNTAGL